MASARVPSSGVSKFRALRVQGLGFRVVGEYNGSWGSQGSSFRV